MAEFPFNSLRDWLEFLEEEGELAHVTEEVNLEEDISSITKELSLREKQGERVPAIIFENIKGYPGLRIASGTFLTHRRRAWALGAPLTREEFLKYMAPRLDSHVPPMEVSWGPCKELKFFGNEVDLTKLPIPYTGEFVFEGTPSITAGVSSKKHPTLNWQNIAVRRYGLKGERVLSEFINPGQQDWLIWGEYRKRGEPCPVAISISVDPTTYLISQAKAPIGFCEYDLWGAFTGTSLEVVRCETSDLLVPAHAEIVIEGEIPPDRREMDGPFPEFCGYYTNITEVARVEVKAVTMRKDPIFYYFNMGCPPTEGNDIGSLMSSMSIFKEISKNFPGIIDCHFPHWLFCIIKVDKKVSKSWKNFAAHVAMDVWGFWPVKWILIVDDDVEDITDFYQVINMMVAKFQGSKDLRVMPGMKGGGIDPSEPWSGGWVQTDLVLMDLTEPPSPYDEGYARGIALPSKSAMEKIRKNWEKYRI